MGAKYSLHLILFIVFACCSVPAAFSHPEHKANKYTDRGNEYARQQDWPRAAKEYAHAIEHGLKDPATAYACATFYCLAEKYNLAFAYLDSAIVFDFTNVQRLRYDNNLLPLHEDPRWENIVDKMTIAQDAYLERCHLNREVFYLWKAAQFDHGIAADTISQEVVTANDNARFSQLQDQLNRKQLTVADDYYNAALILYYSEDQQNLSTCESCIDQAIKLDPEKVTYQWFAAYVRDKHLVSQGKRQIYGTQVSQDENGLWRLEPINETTISDSERTRLGLPTLKELQEQIDEDNHVK